MKNKRIAFLGIRIIDGRLYPNRKSDFDLID
jgi:hypothetical protein